MKGILYFFILLVFIPKQFYAQEKQYIYQMNRLLIDSAYFFSYGRKNVNSTNRNSSNDGFEHNANFCFARYNPKGKKQWEVIINKNRDFIQNSKMVKHGSSYITLLEFMTRNVEAGVFFNTLYFVGLDSLGTVVAEKKIKDSTFYGFNHVYFDNQFIYVTLRSNQLVCEKYDYNFNLVETITSPLVLSFFCDVPNDDAQTEHGIVNVGPSVDIKAINAQTKVKSPVIYYSQQERFIKRIDKNLYGASKIDLMPLPENTVVSMLSQHNGIYFFIQHLLGKEPAQIYKYNDKANKLNLLITDTLHDNSYSISFFYVLDDQDFIICRDAGALHNNPSKYSNILYHIKKGKVLRRTEFNKIDNEHFTSEFRVANHKLYIYETNTFGGDINVRIWDYEEGKFL